MGRPREFEINDAIEKATSLFWRNGYEGTSLSDLTKAIGISPPSFYFAFGSKEGLFKKVIERYFVEQSKLAETAFRKRTPRAVATHFLNGYADVLADSLHAPGCLAMNTSLPCAAGDPLRTWLAELREQMRKRLRDRFAEARGGESLPAGMDVDSLARLALRTFKRSTDPRFAAKLGLARSAARELGPKGIHVAHFNIDGGVRSSRRPDPSAQLRPFKPFQCSAANGCSEQRLNLTALPGKPNCGWVLGGCGESHARLHDKSPASRFIKRKMLSNPLGFRNM